MSDNHTLLRKIEEKRLVLNQAASRKPLFSEEIVQLSKELDQLLNRYENKFNRIS